MNESESIYLKTHSKLWELLASSCTKRFDFLGSFNVLGNLMPEKLWKDELDSILIRRILPEIFPSIYNENQAKIENNTLRTSSPSSTVCLKGPISTSWINSFYNRNVKSCIQWRVKEWKMKERSQGGEKRE